MTGDTTAKAGCGCSRREFIGRGLSTLGATAALPLFLEETRLALAANALAGFEPEHPERILVVLELSGGNDGLNTVVPFTNDEYYRLRPTLGLRPEAVLKVSDEFGFHSNLLGFERLFKDGEMAVIHGCGYPNPNRSHFESMKFWHTGVPNAPEERGWLGRFADAYYPEPKKSYIVNLAKEQSFALMSRVHSPVVFADPEHFTWDGTPEQKEVFKALSRERVSGNPSLDFVRSISATAGESSEFIRTACAEYRSKMDYGYGEIGVDLKRVAAMIAADSPARIYYVSFGGFDTHVSQAGQHGGLFNRLGDAALAFLNDMKRLGRENDVALLMFTEFGRRVKENASLGTDHGVASPMFIVGARLNGGFYGRHPSLTDLDEGDLKMTTDFRSVYATMIKEWMGWDDARSVLKADFPTLGVFA